jgi:4'-phosphopantetheinyl transferase
MIKIYIFGLPLPICDKDKSFLLSKLNNYEIKTLFGRRGKSFELSLFGRVLVKNIVSKETSISKKSILISKTKLGKPIIKKPTNLNIDISISHSDNYLVIGICNHAKIGIDLEIFKNIDLEIFKNCLSVSEEVYINSGERRKQKLENFYEIWTRKEAYLKALGVGLQKPLPITKFYSNYIKPRVDINYNNQQYYFSTLKEGNFILSTCTNKSYPLDQNYTKFTTDKLWPFIMN